MANHAVEAEMGCSPGIYKRITIQLNEIINSVANYYFETIEDSIYGKVLPKEHIILLFVRNS